MECQTIDYASLLLEPKFKPKVQFDTMDAAIEAAKKANAHPRQHHKLVAYKCKKCHKYHIGRNGKLLKKRQNDMSKIWNGNCLNSNLK